MATVVACVFCGSVCGQKTIRNKKAHEVMGLIYIFGGDGEIRTHGGLTSSAVFKTAPINLSGTSPNFSLSYGIYSNDYGNFCYIFNINRYVRF